MSCVACHEEKDSIIINHHVSYYPSKTVLVHRSCHGKIHAGVAYQHLRPDARQVIRFYHNYRLFWDIDKDITAFFKLVNGETEFCPHCKRVLP